jgi:hypothetical protein
MYIEDTCYYSTINMNDKENTSQCTDSSVGVRRTLEDRKDQECFRSTTQMECSKMEQHPSFVQTQELNYTNDALQSWFFVVVSLKFRSQYQSNYRRQYE